MSVIGRYKNKKKVKRGYTQKRKTKKKVKQEPGGVKLDPGFEDPIKIQKLQREGLIPGSQKFAKKAKAKNK